MSAPWQQQRVKNAAKVAVAHLLYYTGVLLVWKAIVFRRRALVLMYHRVLTEAESRETASHPALVVSCRSFSRQMAVLQRHFVVLSVEELAHRMEHGIPLPNSSCVITFDDGWRDNFTNALPVLEQYRLPALVFLPANYIGRRRLFWQEALTHLLLVALDVLARDGSRREELAALLTPCGLEAVLTLPRTGARPRIIAAVGAGKHDAARMRALTPALASALDIDLESLTSVDGFMDWQQAATMAQRRVTFGGHGAEHLLLTQVTPAEIDAELRQSKEMLDEKFPGTVPTFSYPNGYYTPEVARRTKAAGFRLAFITRRGFVDCDTDPFAIPRINVHESVTASEPMFVARMVGLF